jgi:hypothetical protein
MPYMGWSAYGHGEVRTPQVGSREGRNWCQCQVHMIYSLRICVVHALVSVVATWRSSRTPYELVRLWAYGPDVAAPSSPVIHIHLNRSINLIWRSVELYLMLA